jgi:condensin complex subunit 2
LANINSQLVCPTFSKFRFNCDSFNEEFQLENRDDFYYEPIELSDHDDDAGPMNYDDFPIYREDNENPFNSEEQFLPSEQMQEETEMIDQNIIKIVQAGFTKNENNMFSYFDNISGSTWAGPEYWKSRSVRKPVTSDKPTKAASKKKEKQFIDFLNSEPIDPNVLFAKTKTSTLLPKSRLTDTFLLPEDHQYRSDKFTRLFLRPDFTFQEFTEKVESLKQTMVMIPSENRESNQFAYDAPADNFGIFGSLDGPTFDNEPIYGGFDEDDDEVEYPATLTLPTESNYLKADLDGVDSSSLSYGEQLVAEPVRLKSKPLLFARAAKRVDVQKLKENLWSKMADDLETSKVFDFNVGDKTRACRKEVY